MTPIWKAVDPPSERTVRPTLFIDRDGVLIRDMDYLDDPAGVEIAFVPEAVFQ